MAAVWPLDLRVSEKLVLLALADNANDEGYCWPLVSTLMSKCSLCERATQQALATLAKAQHITVHRRHGRSNYFAVHPRTSCTPQKMHPASDAPNPPQILHPPPASGAPITIIEPSRNHQGEVRAPKRARSRSVPDDFEVTEAMRTWAKTNCPAVDLDAETLKFRDHEYRDPHGNWPAAWRQWMRRSVEFKPRANGSTKAAYVPPKSIEQLEAEERDRAQR